MLLGFGLILLGVILLWFSCPVWFPWVLRPIARSQGIRYSDYQRVGYSRFLLTAVHVKSGDTLLDARRVEALVPTVWLWDLAVRTTSPRPLFLDVDTWRYQSISKAQTTTSTDSQIRELQTYIAALKRWLPAAALTNGTVLVDGTAVGVPYASWDQGRLRGDVLVSSRINDLSVDADLSRLPATIDLRSPRLRVESKLALTTRSSGTDIRSTNVWYGNLVEAEAHFAKTGSLPDTASIYARHFTLPSSILKIPFYQNISGSSTGTWSHGTFALNLQATSSPVSQDQWPAVHLELGAHGDTNSVTIETLHLTSSWIQGDISRPLVIAFRGPILRQPVELNVTADLTRQQFYPLKGTLTGTAELEPSPGQLPEVRFHLSGLNVGDHDLEAKSVRLEAQLKSPWLDLEQASAEFDDGSAASFHGRLEIEKKMLQGAHFEIKGPLARRWLPPGYSYKEMALSVEAEGSVTNPVHTGVLDVGDFTSPLLKPLRMHAQWRGRKLNVDDFALSLATTNSDLRLGGSFTMSGDRSLMQLNACELSTNGQPALGLTRPILFSATRSAARAGWQFELTPFHLAGPAGEIAAQASVDWPNQGIAHLSIQRGSSSFVADFLKIGVPALEVSHLETSAGWTNGPVGFSLQGAFRAPEAGLELRAAAGAATGSDHPDTTGKVAALPAVPRNLVLSAELNVFGDEKGITVSNLVVSSGTSNVVDVHGFLPIVLAPSRGTNWLHLDPSAPVHVLATAQPQAFFWRELGRWTGINLTRPQLRLDVSGTWAAPSGEIDLSADRIKLPGSPGTMPELEDLHFVLELARERAVVSEGQLFVQGQPVHFTGELPLGPDFWRNLGEKKPPDWEKAAVKLRVSKAELAAFEPLFPSLLAPEGQLDLDLSVLPGAKLAGEMQLHNARTRPLGDLGPLRHINVKMRFLDRSVRLESAVAEMSSAEVRLAGQADLSGVEWLHGQLPPFTVTVTGTNVPLARQPDIVVRSDLELAVTKTNGAPPLVTGLARLRDSFFLADLVSLVPGRTASPSRRPPYFSVEDPFLADWRLAVGVQGVRFLRVRTPIFNGDISANLKLQGTPKDPIALGDLKIDSGSVRFPFGSLQVQQGLVNLTSQDPYHPQLAVTAASKQFGYDIRMSVTGPVDAPVIQFNSTPPLSSEQILLMVTAGQLPQGTFSLTPQQRAQTVAMFFGRDLLSKLGVGDQSEERLTVRSGEEISEQGRPTYHVEYKLSDRWSLVGEYDRFGDFNAGFKWRILSR